MSKPFKECPHCGAHLDPGEFCECRDKQQNAKEPENPRVPVLIPGA